MYRYRCEQCATTSPQTRTLVEAEHERDRHRQRMHGGHIPDGDHLQCAPRRPDPRGDRIALISLAMIALVLVVSWLI